MSKLKDKLVSLGLIAVLSIELVGCSNSQIKTTTEAAKTQADSSKSLYDLKGVTSYEDIDGTAIVEVKKSMANDDDTFVKQMFKTLADVIALLPKSTKVLQLNVFASNVSPTKDFLIFSCTIPEEGLKNIRKDNLTSVRDLSKNCEQLYIDEGVSYEAIKDIVFPGDEDSITNQKSDSDKDVDTKEASNKDHKCDYCDRYDDVEYFDGYGYMCDVHQNMAMKHEEQKQEAEARAQGKDYCDECGKLDKLQYLNGEYLCSSCYKEYNVTCADCGTSLAFTDYFIRSSNGTYYCVPCGEARGLSYPMAY